MKFYINNLNGVFDDIIPLVDTVDVVEYADKYLLWNDTFIAQKDAHNLGFHKKAIVMSHCFASCNDYVEPNKGVPVSSKYLVWGEYDFRLADRAGIGDKTVITGTPIFSHIKPKVKHKGINIVYCPSHDTDDTSIAELLASYGNVFVKLIDNQKEDYSDKITIIKTDRSKPSHIIETFNLLSQADVVVATDRYSTFVLFAFAAKVPVVYIGEQENINSLGQSYSNISLALQSGLVYSTKETLLDDVENALIHDLLADERDYWCDQMGVHISHATTKILKEIYK